MKKLVLLALLGLFSAMPALAEPVTIRIGFAGIGLGNRSNVGGDTGALVHAEQYLEKEFADTPDVKVEWFFFKGAGPAVNEAIASRQLDFAVEGDLPSLIGRANGLKTRILLGSGTRNNLYLVAPPDSPIASVKDVKGRKVAQFRGTSTHLTTERVIAANGLGDGDIRFVNMDDATALAALAAREVDAAFGKAVFLNAVDRGLAKIVFTTKGDPTSVTSSHLLVTEAFETRYPAVTARVVKAFVRAADWASTEANREALFDIWARSGTPAALYRADFDGQSLAYRNSPLIDDLLVDGYRYKAEQVKSFGLARGAIDLDGWFEPRHLAQALKELGLEGRWARYGADGQPIGPEVVRKASTQ